jgi:hypothetical protein
MRMAVVAQEEVPAELVDGLSGSKESDDSLRPV